MGMGFHELKFLQYVSDKRDLGDVLTIARQNLNVKQSQIDKAFGERVTLDDQEYIDELITKHFGATSVSSIDFSNFENATYVGDLNEKIDLGRQFDTIIDFGTTEHVFDIANALRNSIRCCAVGGRIIHSVPSNSECGHGFFQFSPELFLSLYSDRNGFSDTEVYVVNLMDERHRYRVRAAEPGHRIMVNALAATYLTVSTTKVREVDTLSVQQSDYEHAWKVGRAQRGSTGVRWRDWSRKKLVGSRMANIATLGYRTWLAKTGLTRFNPYLERIWIKPGRPD